MQIRNATPADIDIIRFIAYSSWQETYRDIISQDQISYMLEQMYSSVSLAEQMNVLRHRFVLVRQDETSALEGFVSYETNYGNSSVTKLHKLYVLPQSQGFGLGRILIDEVCKEAKSEGNRSVRLNVNRNNRAIDFYQHIGFDVIGKEDIDIGSGYLMEDNILEKSITD